MSFVAIQGWGSLLPCERLISLGASHFHVGTRHCQNFLSSRAITSARTDSETGLSGRSQMPASRSDRHPRPRCSR